MKKWNCGNWNSFEYIWISPKILSFLAKYLFSSLMYNIIYMNMIYWRTDTYIASSSTTFCFYIIYKTNRFYIAISLYSNRSQKASICGRTSATYAATPQLCHMFVLTPFCIICDLLLNRYTEMVNKFMRC